MRLRLQAAPGGGGSRSRTVAARLPSRVIEKRRRIGGGAAMGVGETVGVGGGVGVGVGVLKSIPRPKNTLPGETTPLAGPGAPTAKSLEPFPSNSQPPAATPREDPAILWPKSDWLVVPLSGAPSTQAPPIFSF